MPAGPNVNFFLRADLTYRLPSCPDTSSLLLWTLVVNKKQILAFCVFGALVNLRPLTRWQNSIYEARASMASEAGAI